MTQRRVVGVEPVENRTPPVPTNGQTPPCPHVAKPPALGVGSRVERADMSKGLEKSLEDRNYNDAITQVREALAEDPAATMAQPIVREWIGRRFRHIFLDVAQADPTAVKHSSHRFPLSLADRRDDRQKIAQRMFRMIEPAEIHAEMPPAQPVGFDNTTLVLCPGLLTGYMPGLALQQELPQMVERFGAKILSADSHPGRSCRDNAADISAALEQGVGNAPDKDATLRTVQDDPPIPGEVVLMGYSKGGPDISAFLIERPDLAGRVRAIISWAGAHGGSYLADDVYKEIEFVPDDQLLDKLIADTGGLAHRFLPLMPVKPAPRRLDEYDLKSAFLSLTTEHRAQFNAANADTLNALGIPTIYFTGSTSASEVTYFNLQSELEMAEYDPLNDMQLTQAQATPPTANAVHAAMFHATHWDMSYDPWPWYETAGSRELKEPFTRYAAMSAILLLLSELGLMS